MASSNHLMSVDVNVFSLAGSSLLDSLQSYTLELPNEMAEGKPIRQLYGQGQVVKKSWRLSPSLMSSVGGTADTHTKVNSAYLSAFTLTNPNVNSGSARDYLATVRSLSLKMDATTREAKGSGDVWAWPEIAAKKLTWELEIMLPGTIGSTDALMTDLAEQAGTTSDHLDGHLWTPSFTLNGVTITAAGVLANFQHVIEEEGLQVYKVTLDGRAPDDPTTAYPAAPTGTSSLLEKALNQRTAIAVSIRNRQTGNNNSIAWAGNALIVGATVNIPQSGLVRVDYTLEGQGALTPTKA